MKIFKITKNVRQRLQTLAKRQPVQVYDLYAWGTSRSRSIDRRGDIRAALIAAGVDMRGVVWYNDAPRGGKIGEKVAVSQICAAQICEFLNRK